MKKKIYYKETRENGDKVSEVYTTDTGIEYYVIVNFTLGYTKLLNGKRRHVIKTFHSKNEKVLLRKAKRFLYDFGVRFEYFERSDRIENAKRLHKIRKQNGN